MISEPVLHSEAELLPPLYPFWRSFWGLQASRSSSRCLCSVQLDLLSCVLVFSPTSWLFACARPKLSCFSSCLTACRWSQADESAPMIANCLLRRTRFSISFWWRYHRRTPTRKRMIGSSRAALRELTMSKISYQSHLTRPTGWCQTWTWLLCSICYQALMNSVVRGTLLFDVQLSGLTLVSSSW